MNYPSKTVRYKKTRNSIQSCLETLGANCSEVYKELTSERYLKCGKKGLKKSFWQVYSKEEARGWVKFLFKQRCRQFHPDINPAATEEFLKIKQAYDKAITIIDHRP